MTEFESRLHECLEALTEGRWDLDECLRRNPEHAAALRPMLQAVGITLNVQKADAATRNQLLSEGTFQMALTSHIGVGGDPDYLRR